MDQRSLHRITRLQTLKPAKPQTTLWPTLSTWVLIARVRYLPSNLIAALTATLLIRLTSSTRLTVIFSDSQLEYLWPFIPLLACFPLLEAIKLWLSDKEKCAARAITRRTTTYLIITLMNCAIFLTLSGSHGFAATRNYLLFSAVIMIIATLFSITLSWLPAMLFVLICWFAGRDSQYYPRTWALPLHESNTTWTLLFCLASWGIGLALLAWSPGTMRERR